MSLPPKRLTRQWLLILAAVLWCVTISGGFGVLLNYGATPGAAGQPPLHWPPGSKVSRSPRKITLLMFAHCQCPCTQASLDELARIMAETGNRIDATVLFPVQEGASEEWLRSRNWILASEIPGVRVLADLDHQETKRFAAKTSGTVLLYGDNGRLLFHGGVTSARGHAGDNAGHNAIVEFVMKQTSGVSVTPVFGCAFDEVSEGPHGSQ